MQHNVLEEKIENEIESESQQNLDPEQLYGDNKNKRDIVIAMAHILVDIAEQNKEIISLLKELVGEKSAKEST